MVIPRKRRIKNDSKVLELVYSAKRHVMRSNAEVADSWLTAGACQLALSLS